MGNPRVVLVLQARMGSTRLPGKSMLPLAGAPLVGRIIERIRRCASVAQIVLATTRQPEDDVLAGLAGDYGIAAFRGAEHDLVDRYLQAGRVFAADVLVRLPADNPVPEPEEIDRIVAYHLSGQSDFSSNLAELFGNGYPNGIGAEVFHLSTLEAVGRASRDARLREHPHLNFVDYGTQRPTNPERFRVGTIECPAAFRRPDLVLDVNTPSEYARMARLYEALYPCNPRFHITDIIAWYDREAQERRGTSAAAAGRDA